MTIPKTLKIGNCTYRIEEHGDGNLLTETRFVGRIDYTNLVIAIGKDLPDERQADTLIHEAVHGILYELGRHSLNEDEAFVSTLSCLVYALIKDNNLAWVHGEADRIAADLAVIRTNLEKGWPDRALTFVTAMEERVTKGASK